MKHKSITFRCSRSQIRRLESNMLSVTVDNRTSFITTALEEFLDFAEQDSVAELDLFELVKIIDSVGNGLKFSTQA